MEEDLCKPVIVHDSLHTETNNNGLSWLNFAAFQELVFRSTFFLHKDIHKATQKSPGQLTTNQIDHVLTKGRFSSNITNIRTYRGADIDSDHYLVAVCIRAKLSTSYQSRQNRSPRLNIKQLRNPQAAEVYAQQLEAAPATVEEFGAASLEDGWIGHQGRITNHVKTMCRELTCRSLLEVISSRTIARRSIDGSSTSMNICMAMQQTEAELERTWECQ
ncbi:uncharacterized protein LOC129720416 [Wyeomyia smithii]|uniref:uncharacterized protein LOC129720416 n=1 Tax=Wyeomyia smithii TaxID=174621 RepID=UPI002467C1F6|nr:uncharacterized protein LOC129720416 [Wyeomyia smithii]